MKKTLAFLLLTFLAMQPFSIAFANEPDSAYIFAYGTNKNRNKNGLHFAWSTDRKNWHPIGPEHRYVSSDYGRWDNQKRMLSPYLFLDNNGKFQCVFSVNEQDGVVAHVASDNLIYWERQSYPILMPNGNCLQPEISALSGNEYLITWLSSDNKVYSTTTKDFKTYTPVQGASETLRKNNRGNQRISGKEESGTIHKVPWQTINDLIQANQVSVYRQSLWNEQMKDDKVRFAGLKPVEATVTIQPEDSKAISNMLIGIFFEDISYAADGGLYAELVQNRDFEYSPADREYNDKEWNNYKAWHVNGEDLTFLIDTLAPIHPNNKHYAVLDVKQSGTGLTNSGFDGIALKQGEKYDFSLFARTLEGNNKKLLIRLTGQDGEIYGEAYTKPLSSEWKKYTCTMMARETVNDAHLEIIPQTEGKIALDMISLFPRNTFKGRKNGLRADLAQTIADIQPRFVRFPGGCVAHGDGLENIYRWENTIGPLESRKPQRNIWGYHQTAGLGYYEYFQFCEDIGAEPVPVVAAGVCCQNSATGGAGQQGGIPMCEMHDYVQDVLNLIEWANGDPKKSQWAKMRADAGHPKPFNLKYVGVGNEDLITDLFEERFTMIYEAVKEKYPDITVIGTAGPFYEGTDYVEGWDIATKLNVPMIDEHYYVPPAWFIYNQDYYDRYDRTKAQVYLGEYAAHVPDRHNNIETALAEALYLTACERNGDIVHMTSYAPLLAKEGKTNWNPDLIYFNNTEVKPTVGYYVQKLYGENAGDEYLASYMDISSHDEKVKKRIACSVVRDSKTNDIIIKLINLLPVEVKPALDINPLNITGEKVIKTVLTGQPEDKDAKPEETLITVSDIKDLRLPAYSFTVLKIKAGK